MSAGGLFTNRVPTPQGVAFRQRQKAVRNAANAAAPRPSTRRPVPADFAAVAPTMSKTALARHYRSSDDVVARWLRETGVMAAVVNGRVAEPMPADVAERAAEMHMAELARHYRVHFSRIKFWLTRLGISPQPFRTPSEPAISTGYRKMPVARKRTHIGANHLVRDASTEGQAADVLRRLAAVYRCTEKGAADPQGGWWRYGSVVLAGAELIERARRHGFDPDAWRRIGLAIAGHEADKFRSEGAR